MATFQIGIGTSSDYSVLLIARTIKMMLERQSFADTPEESVLEFVNFLFQLVDLARASFSGETRNEKCRALFSAVSTQLLVECLLLKKMIKNHHDLSYIGEQEVSDMCKKMKPVSVVRAPKTETKTKTETESEVESESESETKHSTKEEQETLDQTTAQRESEERGTELMLETISAILSHADDYHDRAQRASHFLSLLISVIYMGSFACMGVIRGLESKTKEEKDKTEEEKEQRKEDEEELNATRKLFSAKVSEVIRVIESPVYSPSHRFGSELLAKSKEHLQSTSSSFSSFSSASTASGSSLTASSSSSGGSL